MQNLVEEQKIYGEVEIIITHADGSVETRLVKNTVLRNAKQAAASALTNNIGTSFQFFISSMIFGTNGTVDGAPKYVDDTRNGLFGPTLISKPVLSSVNQQALNQAIFTSVVTFDDGNGFVINEMALQMNNGNLYSMMTFGGITKTSGIQVVFNWRISFI